MTSDAVLNVRLPQDLKDQGSRVLKKNHVTVTGVIRRLYEYMEREQKIPDCLIEDEQIPLREKRRQILRSVAGSIHLPAGLDEDDARGMYLDAKHGSVL